jgi:hypothetical protein
MCILLRAWWGTPDEGRKDFFFKKKKQETFTHGGGHTFKGANFVLTLMDKSFLVLFFKKELLR